MPLRHQIIIVYILLVVYTLPVITTFVYYIFNINSTIDFLHGYFLWMSTLAKDSSSQLNLFHKVLLPIIAGISALSFTNSNVKNAPDGQTAISGLLSSDFRIDLIVFSIIIIICALVVTVGVDLHKDTFEPSAQNAATAFTVFISSISEYVGVYLMLLLGLKSQN